MRLKKSLGQHILTDGRALGRIVRAAGVSAGDVCLEVGPGTGALTRRLAAAGARVIAVEKDDVFAAELPGRLSESLRPLLTVAHADVLSLDINQILAGAEAVKVVANLPFNIATAVVMKLLSHTPPFASLHVLVQDEVAQRLAAPPGDAARGSLSVACQARARVRLLFAVPPAAFRPPPRVMSRLVALVPHTGDPPGIPDMALFERLLAAGFEHRRKTCYNSLRVSMEKGAAAGLAPPEQSAAFLDDLFTTAEVSRTARAQELTGSQWAALARAARSKKE